METLRSIVTEIAHLILALVILAAMGYVSLVMLRFMYRFITG